MQRKLQKSFKECLSKIKNPNHSSNKWILAACKHPKTPSFAFDRSRSNPDLDHHGDAAATLSDIDRFLLENFKSLYIKNDDEDHSQRKTSVEQHKEDGQEEDHQQQQQVRSPGGILFDSPRFVKPPPYLCGSRRFFVTASSSSSLIEDAQLSQTNTATTTTTPTTTSSTSDEGGSSSNSARSYNNHTINNAPLADDDYIAVKTYSRSPSDDFRRSMQEMVDAKLQEDDGKVDWDFLLELLFCYLNLNEKKSHKFILSAFVDVIVCLRQRSARVPARPRRCISQKERRKLRNVT